jgi:hypothetical protein
MDLHATSYGSDGSHRYRKQSSYRKHGQVRAYVTTAAMLSSTGDREATLRVPPALAGGFTSTEVVYGVAGTDVTVLPEYGVSP